MYIHKRKDRRGNFYYSFSYRAPDGKRIRLKKSEHPLFDKREEAESWAKSQEAFRTSQKARVERKLAWKRQYYQFDVLLSQYKQWQVKKAPNSWESNVFFLELFIFPFFLGEKKCSNANDWHTLYQEFKDWLENGA